MKRTLLSLAVLVFIIHLTTESARAQFPSDPNKTFFVCNASGTQTGVQAFNDGKDGYIAVWIDKRDGATVGTAIYVQHLDSAGNPLWSLNGSVLHQATGNEIWNMKAIPWQQGFLVAWIQGPFGRGGDTLCCDYFDMNGKSKWAHPTVVADTNKSLGIIYVNFDNLDIYPNDSGATITFALIPLGGNTTFSFNRIDFSGNLQQPIDVSNYLGGGSYYVTCSDNYGGFYVAASTGGIGEAIFVQHFDIQGNSGPHGSVNVSLDGAGGRSNDGQWSLLCDADTNLYIVWGNNNPGDIIISKLTPGGSFAWSSKYKAVCNAEGAKINPYAILYKNYIYVTWADPRPSASGYYIYLQKLDTAGNAQWTPNGVQLCNLRSYIPYPKVAPAGNNVITAYKVQTGFLAQQTKPDSTPVWAANGIPVNTINPPLYGDYKLVTALDGSVAAFWSDNENIAAAKIRPGVSGSVATSTENSFDIFPEPASDRATITLPKHLRNIRISVCNIEGKEIMSQQADAEKSTLVLNVSDLKKGVYFVRLISGRNILVRKMVVQ